jgi:hypothetical protein
VRENAVDANSTKARVSPSENNQDSREGSTSEDLGFKSASKAQDGAISANAERLIAELSEQIGERVQEASTFLATLEEAPRMLTADPSSTSLLDGANITVSHTTSPLVDVIDRADSALAKQVIGAKQQSAKKRSKRRREIEVLIQVLLTRQMEAKKREKLLRMLLALGISEIEYRALVSKLGEMEVAAQAVAAESQKTSEKEREVLLVEPLLREPESPRMKSHENDPSAPPRIKSAPSVTRGDMYKRLLKEKEKNSS